MPAQEVVGMMYAVGKGVQQDYKEAARWFLTAAEAGNPRAAANFVATSRSLRGDVELAPRSCWTLRNTLPFPDGKGYRDYETY